MNRSRLVARNILVTLGTQIFSWALSFAVIVYVPRYVGDAGLGKLAFAGTFVSLFGVFVPLGTTTVLVREIARDRSRTGELLVNAILLRLLLGLLMAAVAIGTVYVIHYPPLIRTLVVIYALGMIIGNVNNALGTALQGQENIPRQSAGVIVERFLSSSLIIALAFARDPLWILVVVGVFTGLVSLVINLTAFRSLLSCLPWPSLAVMRSLIVTGMPFFASVVFQAIYNQIDIPILRFMTNDREVGWYSMAARLLGTTLVIPVAFATTLLPTLTKMHAESEARFMAAVQRALGILLLCVIPIATPLILFPEQILLNLFRLPVTFRPSAPVLSVYGFGCIFWYITQITSTTLIILNRQKAMSRVFCVAMALTICGCLIMIPLFQRWLHNGAFGAALVDVGVEVFIMVSFFMIIPRGFFTWASSHHFLKAMAAAIPLLLLMLVIRSGWMEWLGVALGLACYFLLCYWFGCFSKQDIAMFKLAISRRVSI